MAGDWLKVEKVTPDKWEIEAMAERLAMDPDSVFGKCFRVWRWFDDHTTDGNAPRVTKSAVDRRAGVTGFADAMESVNWLVADDSGVHLPHFERHNGQTSKQRALTAKRVAQHKAKGNATANANGNDASVTCALPREEKRREDIPPPPSPPPASNGGDGVLSQAWKGVVEDLRKCGVGRAIDAAKAARSNGCSVDEVVNVIAFWRLKQPAWNAGALFERVSRMMPTEDCSEFWPDPSKEFHLAESRRETSKRAADTANARIEGDKRRADDEAARKKREADFGPMVDAMSRDEIVALIREKIPADAEFLLGRLARTGLTGVVREALLGHFEVVAKRPTLVSGAAR